MKKLFLFLCLFSLASSAVCADEETRTLLCQQTIIEWQQANLACLKESIDNLKSGKKTLPLCWEFVDEKEKIMYKECPTLKK